jgi:hypothetical protein
MEGPLSRDSYHSGRGVCNMQPSDSTAPALFYHETDGLAVCIPANRAPFASGISSLPRV